MELVNMRLEVSRVFKLIEVNIPILTIVQLVHEHYLNVFLVVDTWLTRDCLSALIEVLGFQCWSGNVAAL